MNQTLNVVQGDTQKNRAHQKFNNSIGFCFIYTRFIPDIVKVLIHITPKFQGFNIKTLDLTAYLRTYSKRASCVRRAWFLMNIQHSPLGMALTAFFTASFSSGLFSYTLSFR